jgi:hypothetical protein
MFELALAASEPVRNFAQGASLGQLAKEHRYKLIPTAEAFAPVFSLEFPDVMSKIRALKKGKNLGKQTGGGIHF